MIDVSVELDHGEVVGLVSDNGAGKSTLVKCIAGVVQPRHCAIHLSGTRHEFESPAEALAAGVETVYQDLGSKGRPVADLVRRDTTPDEVAGYITGSR